jgi:hypothetical protein
MRSFGMSSGGADISALTTVREELDDLVEADSVLLLGPFGSLPIDAVCGTLLSPHGPEQTHYVCVTFDDTPAEQLEHWEDHVGQLPRATSVVVTSQGTGNPESLPESVTVKHVPDASDIPRLGITISDRLSADAENVVCCFDNLTALLQYADLQRVYRFVHTLNGRLASVDAVSHYHMDPSAHDRQTISTLRPQFDAVIEVGTDGSVEIH